MLQARVAEGIGPDLQPTSESAVGLNVRAWREAMNGRSFIAGTVLALFMCALALHPRSASWFGVQSYAPAVLFAAWPLMYAFALRTSDRVCDGSARWPIVALVVHGAAIWSTLGACSSIELGVGWCFFLLMPPCWGHMFPRNHALFAATIVAPPVQRIIFTHDATVRSVAIAAGMGVLVAFTYWTFSLRHARKLVAEQRALAREALGASTLDGTATLHVAMGLHDRLSGAVMLARAQARAGDADEILRAATSLSQHARAVFERARFAGDVTVRTLRASLEEFARHVGVDLQMDVHARADAPDSALEDLGQILVELLANEARHGGGAARVVIEMRRAAVHVSFRSATPIPASGSGRGLRNIALRARARGGHASIGKSGELELVLPLDSHVAVLLLEALVHFALPALVWIVSHNLLATAAFGGVSFFLGIVQANGVIRVEGERRAERARRRRFIEQAAQPAFLLACEELTPVLERLELAVQGGDAGDARAVIDVVSQRLSAVLLAFETAARDGSDARASLLSATTRAEAQPAPPASDP